MAKRNFFRITVETVLLYGSVTLTLTKKLENKLDFIRTYTIMLRAILNKYWHDHPTNAELYGNIPPIREIIIRNAGHCYRSDNELVSKVILWITNHDKIKGRAPSQNLFSQLKDDVDLDIGDMKNAMKDGVVWKIIVTKARANYSIQYVSKYIAYYIYTNIDVIIRHCLKCTNFLDQPLVKRN